MMKFSIFLFLISSILLGDIKLGYVPSGINEFVMTKYKGDILSEYFSKKVNENIQIVKYKSFKSLKSAIISKSVDIAVIPNYKYRGFVQHSNIIVNISKTGKKLSSYMVIVNRSSNINNTKDLDGKVLACSGNTGNVSFLGSVIKKHPEDAFSKVIKERSPSRLLKKLVTNQADVTCVNEGIYNSIIKYRPAYRNKLKILYKSKEFAPDLIIASQKLSSSKLKQIRSTLLNMRKDPEGGQVLVSLKISRFISPINGEKNYPILRMYKKGSKTSDSLATKKKDNSPKLNSLQRKKISRTRPKDRKKRANIKNNNDISVNTVTENKEGEELKKIRLQNENLQKELDENKRAKERKEEIAKIRKEEQIKAQRRVKPRIIHLSKAEKPNSQNNSSVILYFILALFVIILVIIFIIIKNMKKQSKKMKEFKNQDELVNDFYGDSGVNTIFNVDMPEFTGATVIGTVVRIALSGELEGVSVAKVFKKLIDDEKTGILTLSMDGPSPQLIDIQFNQGKITTAFCKTGGFQTKLKNNIIKEVPDFKDKIETIFNNSLNNQEKFCTLLRTESIVETDKLDSMILVQAKEIILSIFLWKKGNYQFKEVIEDDLDLDENVTKLQFDVTALVQEGINRHKEWKYISKSISKANNKVVFKDGERDKLIKSNPNKNLLEVILLIDGTRTIRDIGNISRFSDFKILKLLARLKEKGYLEFSEY